MRDSGQMRKGATTPGWRSERNTRADPAASVPLHQTTHAAPVAETVSFSHNRRCSTNHVHTHCLSRQGGQQQQQSGWVVTVSGIAKAGLDGHVPAQLDLTDMKFSVL